VGESFLAISGRSGAGKTTTARIFERAGARLVSEDLVILSLADESPLIFLGGERFARNWARATAPHFDVPGQEVDFADLSRAQQGAVVPLTAMWFIDVSRRVGTDLQLRKLSIGDGTLALLGNGMLATSHAQHWRDFLRRSRFIAERTSLSEATMPKGVDHLKGAAERYMVNSTS
jgi:hypothetical protein